VVGHRGGSHNVPENTGAAFRWAFDETRADVVDGCECDVHFTKDNRVVVLHDSTLWRTAKKDPPVTWQGSTKEYKQLLRTHINELNYAQVKDVDIGSWKGPEFATERLVTLEEAAGIVPEAKTLLVEIKGGDIAIVQLLVTLAKTCPHINHKTVTWISFDKNILSGMKSHLPAFQVYLLAHFFTTPSIAFTDEAVVRWAREALDAGLDGIDLPASTWQLTHGVVETVRRREADQAPEDKRKLTVGVWCYFPHMSSSDSELKWEQMRDRGVDFFTSDLPPEIFPWIRCEREKAARGDALKNEKE